MRQALADSALAALFFSIVLTAPAQQVKVMQWNVHGNLGNTGSNSSAAAQALARIVNYNQPDIITFNELVDNGTITTAAAMIDWVTNNLTYFGNKTGVTFWVNIATQSDGFSRNGSISRYPISGAYTYSDGGNNYTDLRGMESFKAQLSGTNALEIFHVHLKCCSTTTSCPRKQEEAGVDATNMVNWASTNTFPYVFTGDCNEDENPANSECATNATYHPITTLRQVGGLLEYIPKTLTGGTLTWSSTSQSIRFDYVLPSTNRISLTASNTVACITTGIVFNSSVWGTQYTSVIPNSTTSDSGTASDHLCVQVTYRFPTSGATNFTVTPTNTFTSSGSVGGPFSPSSQAYTLTNTDTIPLFWSVTKTSSWLTVSALATNSDLGIGLSTNITAYIVNSVATNLSAGTYTDAINFSNTATGVSISRGVTLTVGASAPSAVFTGSPTNGTAPLLVTFTDASTGSITNWFWNFGDGNTTNFTASTNPTHTYAAGTNTVTLIVSGSGGVSTNTKANYIAVTPAAPVASFSGTPTSGTEPLLVTFTDASTGSITSRFWDFGDSGTTNITTNSVVHTYSAGTNTVTLVVTGPGGVNTNTKPGYITVFTAFQSWQIQYFSSTTNTAAAPDADPDGDGCNNLCEFLSGTDPTNSASSLHITSVTAQGPDLLITWATGKGRTNVVQSTAGLPDGSFSNNFTNQGPLIIMPAGSGDFTTNYPDPGAATNSPARYYRIRLQP